MAVVGGEPTPTGSAIGLSRATLRFEFREPPGAWTLKHVEDALGLVNRLLKAPYDILNRLDDPKEYPPRASVAELVTIQRLSAGSLELVVLLPAALATVKFLGPFMDVVKRALTLDVEIRGRREELKAEIAAHRARQAESVAQLTAIKSAGVEALARSAPRPQLVVASVDEAAESG